MDKVSGFRSSSSECHIVALDMVRSDNWHYRKRYAVRHITLSEAKSPGIRIARRDSLLRSA